jgi:hypothetical protein
MAFLLVLRSAGALTRTRGRVSTSDRAWRCGLALPLLVVRLDSFGGHSGFLGCPPPLELELGQLCLLVLAFLLLDLEQALGRHLELIALSLGVAFVLLYV